MKEKDIKTEPSKQQFILYAEKNDGSYGTIESGSYLVENLLDDFWVKMAHIEKIHRQKLLNREISPIHYYMLAEELTPSELAKRAGLPMSRIKKHLTYKGFCKARLSDLEKYAVVFNIHISCFFQIIISSDNENTRFHFYNKLKDKEEKNRIILEKTGNPFVVIAKVEENTK